MPKSTKARQVARKAAEAPMPLRARKMYPVKAGHSKPRLLETAVLKLPVNPQSLSRLSEKRPLTEVTGNVGFDQNTGSSQLVSIDTKTKNVKITKRALSDSSVSGNSQDSMCGYSATVLKVEAFDILHKLLNFCCRSSSLDVLDASKILQQITPEIMNTVVQMLGQNIIKSNLKKKDILSVSDSCDTGDEEIKVIVAHGGEKKKTEGKEQIIQSSSSSPDPIQPRHCDDSSSSSPVSAAVDALMSFTGEKATAGEGKKSGNLTSKEQEVSSKVMNTSVSLPESVSQAPEICPPVLLGGDGVVDVTESVFKGDAISNATITTSVPIPNIIDTVPSSETAAPLAHSWMPPFHYPMTKAAGNQDKHMVQDDLNLLPNIQSILNPVSPLSGVPEMTLSIPHGFSPLGCESASMSIKGEPNQQAHASNSPVAPLAQKKSALRTILPKPISAESTLRGSSATLPIAPHRALEQIASSGSSMSIATLIPTMTYTEQQNASSGVTIKSLPLISTNPLLLNQANINSLLTTLSGHNVLFEPSILNAIVKPKEPQPIASPVCSLVSIPPIFDKGSINTSQVFTQIQEKFNPANVLFQQSTAQGTSVTYTENLKDKVNVDVGLPVSKESLQTNPPKLEKGSNLEAASALLSMGSRNKDSKNNSQVVSNFNRQRHTFDIEEQSMGQRGDILFTSTGTFQIEDIEIDPKKNKIEKDNYACGKCGRVFTSIIYLARHIKRVCPDMSHRKWKCDRCEKAFRHPFGLQQHIYTHTGERPYKCEQCAKAFYSANDLRRHKRTHSGERPYQCSHCHKAFSTTISLKTHTYIHTGERPHKCPVCGKTFATSSKLSRHVVTHSDQRPFACDLCPKTFNRSGDLRRHYNHVHQQEHGLMECDECNKVFATSKCLVHHKATHNRDKPQEKIETQVGESVKHNTKEES